MMSNGNIINVCRYVLLVGHQVTFLPLFILSGLGTRSC